MMNLFGDLLNDSMSNRNKVSQLEISPSITQFCYNLVC